MSLSAVPNTQLHNFSPDVNSIKLAKSSKPTKPCAQICGGKPVRSESPYQRRSPSNLKNKDICTVMEASSSRSATSTFTEQNKPVCGVCSDRAKSYHFGGISCDSCKAFFRRAVQNEGYRNFRCSQTRTCVMSMKTRKSCQSCRFEKCISIGMEIKWVMSDEERLVHNLNRTSRPKGVGSATVTVAERGSSNDEEIVDPLYVAKEEDMLKHMSAAEKKEIESIIEKYRNSYDMIPYGVPHTSGNRNPAEIIKMFTTILRRFVYFSKSLPDYAKLSSGDQENLLRAGVLEMCLLRGAFAFDMENNHWPRNNIQTLKNCPRLRLEDMQKLVSSELYEMHKSFINGIQKLKADEPTVMLLLLVVLFYPDRANVEDNVGINRSQEKFIVLLQKYVKWRYGPVVGVKIFPKLLTKLSDLRQLNDVHTEYNLKLAQTDLNVIQTQLGQITLGLEGQHEQLLNNPQFCGMEKAVGNVALQSSLSLPPPAPPPSFNPAQQYFQHFIHQKIPSLIQNPFAPISFQNEFLQARALLQQQTSPAHAQQNIPNFQERVLHFPEYDSPEHPLGTKGFNSAEPTSLGHVPMFSEHIYEPREQGFAVPSPGEQSYGLPTSSNIPFPSQIASQDSSFSPQANIQQMQEMLESLGQVTDVNLMRHLKNSLSTSALSNLENIFGIGIPPNFDISTISPEMIASFTGGAFGGSPLVAAENPSRLIQHQTPPTTHTIAEEAFQWDHQPHQNLQQPPIQYSEQQSSFETNYEQYLSASGSSYDSANYETVNN